jgi:hypothetical protein
MEKQKQEILSVVEEILNNSETDKRYIKLLEAIQGGRISVL